MTAATRRDETRRDETERDRTPDAARRASSGRRMTNQVTGRGRVKSPASSTTNLQDLVPAEAELIFGGRREVVLRHRLHILCPPRRRSLRETGDRRAAAAGGSERALAI